MHFPQNDKQQKSDDPLSATNEPNGDEGKGWIAKASNGVLNMSAGALTYGWGGLKWALESTTNVGSTLLNAGSEGVSQLKKRATKDKNE